MHDTITKHYRHLNFFQRECVLEVRTRRVNLPDESVRLIKPRFAGKLSGFTLLFEVPMLARQIPFAVAARRIARIYLYQALTIYERYVEPALEQADFSAARELAIDETSRVRGHGYVTLATDAGERRVVAVTEGRDAATVAAIVGALSAHGCPLEQIDSASIDTPQAFIKGCAKNLPNARITFDKFQVSWHANAAVDKTRRVEQRSDPALRPTLKGMRSALLKDALPECEGGRSTAH